MSFRVYMKGEHPKKKKLFYDGDFPNRQAARSWCRNHSYLEGLTIVHPDGKEEAYE